jgi:hypothetical protein
MANSESRSLHRSRTTAPLIYNTAVMTLSCYYRYLPKFNNDVYSLGGEEQRFFAPEDLNDLSRVYQSDAIPTRQRDFMW